MRNALLGNSYSDPHSNRITHTNANCYAYRYSDSYGNPNCNAYLNTYRDSDTYPYGAPDSNTYANTMPVRPAVNRV